MYPPQVGADTTRIQVVFETCLRLKLGRIPLGSRLHVRRGITSLDDNSNASHTDVIDLFYMLAGRRAVTAVTAASMAQPTARTTAIEGSDLQQA